MCGHAKHVGPPLFDGIHKEYLHHREVQLEQHVQDTVPHQHTDDIGVNKDRWNLGYLEKLLQKRRKGEAKPSGELLLGKENVLGLYSGQRLTILKMDEVVVRNEETLTELLFIKQLVVLFYTGLSSSTTCPDSLLTFASHTGRSDVSFCWHLGVLGRIGSARRKAENQDGTTWPNHLNDGTPKCASSASQRTLGTRRKLSAFYLAREPLALIKTAFAKADIKKTYKGPQKASNP